MVMPRHYKSKISKMKDVAWQLKTSRAEQEFLIILRQGSNLKVGHMVQLTIKQYIMGITSRYLHTSIGCLS